MAQEFPIRYRGRDFKVSANSQEEAVARARAFVEAHPEMFEEQGPREEKGPPADLAGPPPEPEGAVPEEIASMPSLDEGTNIARSADGSVIPETEKSPNPIVASLKRFGDMMFGQALRTSSAVKAAPEAAITMATGAAGEVVGGLAGTAVGLSSYTPWSDADYNDAAETVEWISDAMTFQPVSENAKAVLQNTAEPLMAIENGVDNIAVSMAPESPFIAAGIKTMILGLPEVVGFKGASRLSNVVKHTEGMKRVRGRVENIAARMGVDMTHKNLADSVVNAANRILPTRRAEHADFLQDSLRQARTAEREALDATYKRAREAKAKVRMANLDDLGKTIREDLLGDGFDLELEGMGAVKNVLDDLDNFRSKNPVTRTTRARVEAGADPKRLLTANFGEVEVMRRRLVRAQQSGDKSVRAAATRAKKHLDDFIDTQLTRDLISGDKDAIGLWQKAREENVAFKNRWDNNRIIKKMLDEEATPEMVHSFLLGASAMGASKQAGAVLRRLKDIFGESSPQIRGIRQDFLHEIAAPLFSHPPNFKGFIRQYDQVIRRNPTLVKELGLAEKTDLKPLRDFAEIADRLPENKRLISANDLTTLTSRFLLGHEIAKAAIRVQLGRNFFNLLVGADRVGRRQIMSEVSGAMFGEPIAPINSSAYGIFALAEAQQSLTDTAEEIRRDEGK